MGICANSKDVYKRQGLVGMKTEDELLAFEQFYRDRLVVITPVKEKFLRMKEQKEMPVECLFQEPVILREKGSGSGKSAGRFPPNGISCCWVRQPCWEAPSTNW